LEVIYLKLTCKYLSFDESHGHNEHGTFPKRRGTIQADNTNN